MAKKQIKNYVFKPGIGALDNVYPNAYSLLSDNKNFIISEAVEYINQEIIDAVKCQRDIGYIIDGVAWDVALGTNYNAIFLGLTEVNSLDLSPTVFRTINRAKASVAALPDVLADATSLSRSNSAFDEVLDIAQNGRTAASTHSYSNPTNATTSRIAAKDKIIANLDFLAAEVNAWVNVTYPLHNHDVDKCTRDTKYALYAAAYDVLYGGNSATYDSAKFFYYFASSGLSGISAEHKAQTVAAYRHLQSIISDVVQGNAITASVGNTELQVTSGSNSNTSDGTVVANLIDVVADVVENGTASLPGTRTVPSVTWAASGIQLAKTAIDSAKTTIIEAVTWDPDYTYNQSKCERDMGFVIDAYLYDLRYGGNEKLRNSIKYYWDQDVAQIDGNRIPEIDTHGFIGDLINNYILTNQTWNSISGETQVIDTTKTAEAGAITKIATMVQNTIDVISNGLSSMPEELPTGVGTVTIQGYFTTDELLLITNTTRNEIIYNFSSLSTGGSVSIKRHGEDVNFVKYEQTTDGVTTITLNYDTSNHSATDDLQIFTETTELTVRPFDFGTDAIERMRIAPPMSMLDADFEYGLQPTKWSAIGTLRGYPSVYEIPGTDTSVLSVVTDASTGTEGVGQSKITVTTVGPHGWTAGTPITIKAFENSITGAARAEGSFIIDTVPSSNTLTYYAKAKVGSTDGQILSTAYTQLRQAGFYTGSSIGSPQFSIFSNGSFGTMYAQLNVETGSDVIPFDGPQPEVGSPLVHPSIPTGSQVTSIVNSSSGGGTYFTGEVVGRYPAGTTTLTLSNASGIVENLAVDRGDGYSIYVTDVTGNDVTFNDDFVNPVTGNIASYTNIAGSNEVSIGQDATFDIALSGTSYVIDAINNDGSNYEVGDRILILGTDLGGATPLNDAVIIVDTVFSDGAISAATIEGTAFDGTGSYTSLSATPVGGTGDDAFFDISWENGSYTSVTLSTPNNSAGYTINDILKIPGSTIDPVNGVDGVHDLYITITAVGAGGTVSTFSYFGTAPNYTEQFIGVPFTTSGIGTGAAINVTADNGSYTVAVDAPGIDYLADDTITVSGSDIGGTSPTNDLTITITNIGSLGEILTTSVSGVAFNGDSAVSVVPENLIGSGATFNVTFAAGVYTVTLTDGGSNYGDGQQLKILGTALNGISPDNDVTITITGVDDLTTGAITSITSSGTSASAGGPFTAVEGVLVQNFGINARFDVDRNYTVYENFTVRTAGLGYEIGNRIRIPGSILDGGLINDIVVRVTAIDLSGGITTVAISYEEAVYGINLDFISTVTISDATDAAILVNDEITYEALATVEINFASAHGLVPGDTFIVTVDSDDGANNHSLAAGSYFATNIPSITSLRYQVRAPGSVDVETTTINGTVYPRPDSFFIHRPYDGGVQLGTGGPQHGAQAIRQSKKYIRYQSGKGIMYTTGALFAPSYDLRSITAEDVEVGSLITVVTDDNDHGVQVGGIIRILGVETPGYNSGPGNSTPPYFDYEVVDVDDERTFKIRAQRRLGSTNGVLGFGSQMSVVSWHGATVRSGIFDDQNGIFWEYDGTQISVNQRTGTKQIAGTISVNVDSNLVTGTNTRFRDQITAGDRFIIKGMTHVVSHVIDDTTLTMTPDWRGVINISGVKANLVVDKKVKQSDFNLDRLDGTGPSGYDIDIAKMQMIGIQYSWYGAGFIDFMLRGSNGNFVFCHRMRNSNVNTEAFMRSGNLPVRYEVTNEGPPGKLAAAMDNVQTTIPLVDSSFFPNTGTVYIDNEIISFTGNNKTTNTLTGCIRAATLTNFQAGAIRSYTASTAIAHTSRTGVILISNTITPLISHWGSAFLTDGGFDEDRGYIFSYAATGVSISTTKTTAFMIRLAPSVSNAITGDLGERELLNRAQLLLQGLEITSDTGTGGIVVQGVLNPQNYPVDPGSVSWSGLSSQAQGGQPSFAQIAPGGAINWNGGASLVTRTVASSANIDTATYTPLVNGTNENNSPIEIATSVYNAIGAVYIGADIYSVNPSNAYTGGSQGTYRVTNIRTSGSETWIDFVSTTGRTQKAANWTGTPGVFFRQPAYTGFTNRLIFAKAAWETGGATSGTAVSTTDTNWPAGTAVSSITLKSLGGIQFYEVVFNQTSIVSLTSGASVIFEFGEPASAQPGETVFSFIANPGERSTLDLSELKELTNTPLGGRGTFPNGPDVLAINIYKISGAAVKANIIVRWGEAQA